MTKDFKLYPHNQEILNQICSYIDNGEHSIFYSEATGLGKSTILVGVVDKYFMDKKVLYITPEISIYDNLKSKSFFKPVNDVIDMVTYASFNNKNNIIKYLNKYDAVFIDEAHHITSPIQGRNIQILMDLLKRHNKYVFGLSATPESTDNFNDSVADFFDINIQGLNIYEAIDRGLFPHINYDIALTNEDELPEDCRAIVDIESSSVLVKDVLHEYDYVTHWLVYFPTIAELKRNKQKLEELLPNHKVFEITSEKSRTECDCIIKQFEKCDSNTMLLSVNKVLEGSHIDNVGGILLYRNTSSLRVFKQILGRVCKVYNETSPVFIDMVDTISPEWLNPNYIKNIKDGDSNKGEGECSRCNKQIFALTTRAKKHINLMEILRDMMNGIYSYGGYTWVNDTDLSRQLGYNDYYVCQCKKDGKTYEQIIDKGPKPKKPKCKNKNSYGGYTWVNDADLSRQLGYGNGYVNRQILKGKTYEQIIDKGPKINSYGGYTWVNDTDLSRQLGYGDGYVCKCKRDGKTYEQIIDKGPKPKCKNKNS